MFHVGDLVPKIELDMNTSNKWLAKLLGEEGEDVAPGHAINFTFLGD